MQKLETYKEKISLNNILVGIFILLAFGGCNNTKIEEKNSTDWKKDALNGNVKSIKEIEYMVINKFGETTKGGIYSVHLTEYNPIGNKTNDEIKYFNDNSGWKRIFIYDNDNHLVENSSYDLQKNLIWKIKFEYDEKGNITKEFKTNIIDNQTYISIIIKKYNKQNQLIETNIYKTDGTLDSKFLYEYNKSGKVIVENFYDENGNLNDKGTYKYDEYGKIVEFIEFGDKTITEYKKDETINTTFNSENELEYKTIFKENKKYSITEYYDGENKLWKKENRSFDKKKNWIEIIEYKGEICIPERIITREIEYYD